MSLIQHAKSELEIAGMFGPESAYGGMIGEAVMELVELFAKQGHSGMSASLTLALFKKVADYKTLTPITGQDDEWTEVSFDEGLYQNKRLSSVFKKGKDGKPYYLDAIIWTEGDSSFSGTRQGISSHQSIKSFPFTPKTFKIEVEGDLIKNHDDLDQVWDYYDQKI